MFKTSTKDRYFWNPIMLHDSVSEIQFVLHNIILNVFRCVCCTLALEFFAHENIVTVSPKSLFCWIASKTKMSRRIHHFHECLKCKNIVWKQWFGKKSSKINCLLRFFAFSNQIRCQKKWVKSHWCGWPWRTHLKGNRIIGVINAYIYCLLRYYIVRYASSHDICILPHHISFCFVNSITFSTFFLRMKRDIKKCTDKIIIWNSYILLWLYYSLKSAL